ncbi:tetratricopeptide repeat protein [Gemmatimonas sp.]|uniref:tetratricopeptide repeat protein n=1 Tax=Gemmatimonas sp. TaxID=1962908 RepID=UPI00286D89C8|nr:tetratricopeptide repeat protein [Gemmatimonas sp.]
MTTGFEPNTSDARAALNAARFVLSPESTSPAPAVWAGAQQVLRAVTARPELSGQALIGEARRMGALTLTDAHALVALVTWADASDRPAESESERTLLREAWLALDHAVSMNRAAVSDAPLRPTVNDMPAIGYAPPPDSKAPLSSASPSFDGDGIDARTAPRWLSARGIVIALLAVGALTAIGWWVLSQRADRAYQDGVAAYGRGAREVARTAFAKAALQHPDDAGPLVFLGRMSREEGDLPRARRFLTTAVRIAPNSALANRELGSVMLADGQPEIARRFYVRALQLDPADRVAQGFLGCALFRLNRFDEARRWTDRAGPGDWSRCSAPMPLPGQMPSPLPAPGYPTLPPR